jgi:hypothetical protein
VEVEAHSVDLRLEVTDEECRPPIDRAPRSGRSRLPELMFQDGQDGPVRNAVRSCNIRAPRADDLLAILGLHTQWDPDGHEPTAVSDVEQKT